MLFRKQITSIALASALVAPMAIAFSAAAQATSSSGTCPSQSVSPSVSTSGTLGGLASGVKGYFFDVTLVGVKKQCVGSIGVLTQAIDGSQMIHKATDKFKYKKLPDGKIQLSVTARLGGALKISDIDPKFGCNPKQIKAFSLKYLYGGHVHLLKIPMESLAICTK